MGLMHLKMVWCYLEFKHVNMWSGGLCGDNEVRKTQIKLASSTICDRTKNSTFRFKINIDILRGKKNVININVTLTMFSTC